MKRFTLRSLGTLVLTLLFFFQLSAQVKKGNKLAKQKDWIAAEAAYRVQLDHPKYGPAAKLGLARVLTHRKAPAYAEITEAIQLANEADQVVRAAGAKQKKKLRKLGCTQQRITQTRADIVKKGLTSLEKTGDILAYDAFITAAGPPIRSTRAKREAVRAALVQKAMEGLSSLNYAACSSLIKNHSDLLRKNNLEFQNQLDSRLYRTFIDEYGYDQLDRFQADHPQHWVAKDCWLPEFVAAIRRPGAGPLLAFLRDYPLTILSSIAQDEINQRARGDQNTLSADERERLEELKNNQRLRNSLLFADAETLEVDALLPTIERGAPSTRAYYLLQRSVNLFLKNGQWDKALAMLRAAQSWFPDGQPEGCTTRYTYYYEKQEWFEAAIDIISRPSESIELVPIDELNTSRKELSPVIDVSGDILFYAMYNPESYSTDIYRSEFDHDEQLWQQPSIISDLSSDLNEAPLSITSDGNTLLLFRDGKLYLSQRREEGWSRPDSLTSAVNAFPWIGRAVLSADGERLIFAASDEALESYRESNIDLYLATRQNDGSFGDPVPLSSTLNTPDEDRSPFLHHDMKTLYFSSDGHPGLGENDIFVTRRLDDTWTNWSPPENLGKEINTMDNDWGYNLSISPSGSVAYLSSDNLAGFHGSDLYTTGLPEHLKTKPESQLVIMGKIKNSSERAIPEGTTVIIRRTDTKEILAETATRPDGTFTYTLPRAQAKFPVEFIVVHKVIFPNAEPVTIDTTQEVTRLAPKNIVAVPDMLKGEVPAPIEVSFELNSTVLDTASFANLDVLFNMVNNKPYFLSLSGHTDNEGSAEHNLQLSENRARSVYDYLLKKGLSADRMEVKGFGFQQPVAENDTEAGRAKNRRVEVRMRVIKEE